MASLVSVKLLAILCLALVLVGIAVAVGIAFTPALCTVAAFLSAVLILAASTLLKLFAKPSDPNKKP